MKGIYFVVPVCGGPYVDRWLRYGLPSLLAPGNLPSLAKHHRLKLLLCVTQDELPQILASPATKAAREVMGVRVIPLARNLEELATKITGGKFGLMNICHNYGADLAWQDDYGLICGLADAIYTDGSFSALPKYISAGKRAVICQGLDVQQDRFEALLDEFGLRRDSDTLTIPPRTFAQIAVRCFHSVTQSMVWTSEQFTYHPSVLYWPIDGHGVLLRGFHLYPVFIYPDRKAKITTTIDGDFLGDAISDLDQCAFIHDSDEFFFAGVSDHRKSDFVPSSPRRADPLSVAQWMLTNTKPFQRDVYIHQKFWLHDGIDRASWRHVELDSDRAVSEILQNYERLTADSMCRVGGQGMC